MWMQKLFTLASTFSLKTLQEARADLSARYQKNPAHAAFRTQAERIAYAITRMPATYGVAREILTPLAELSIQSHLDLGSGPGTVLWAAKDIFPTIIQRTAYEQDDPMLALAQDLWQAQEMPVTWKHAAFQQVQHFEPHDLITLSYVLGELAEDLQQSVLTQAFHATQQALVLMEPGTPRGYETLMRARNQLIAANAFILAPCPHHHQCPLSAGDWCHFSKRIHRTALHRQLKGGDLPYEDEKYCYLVALKAPHPRPAGRLIKRPQGGKGHVILDICHENGLKKVTVSKRHKDLYGRAKKAQWGDGWTDQ